MFTSKKLFLQGGLALVLAMALILTASLTLAASVEPLFVAGNPSCASLGYDFGYKVDPPASGTFDIGGGETITVTTNGVYFDWSSTIGIDAVISKGGPNSNVYVYDPPAEAFNDSDLHSPINPNTGQPFGLSHIEFCYDYELAVEKTALTEWKQDIIWTIDKRVDPTELHLFTGESGDANYEVEVTKTLGPGYGYRVYGEIHISNPSVLAVNFTVTDVVSPDIEADVVCPSSTVPAGGSVTCTYSADLPDGEPRTNTATVESQTAGVDGGEDTADVIFFDSTKVGPESVTVEDTNGESWSTDGNAVWTYSRTFTCDADEGEHPNTATIVETEQSDSALVTVYCYAPTVEKDAETSWTRTVDWTIEKDVDVSLHQLFTGESGTSNYTVTLTKSVGDAFSVSGTITVYNPYPSASATVSVVDTLPGATNLVLSCGGTLIVPPNSSATCDYSADLPDNTSRTNTVTISMNGYEDSDTADVIFGSPTLVGDPETVNVTDSYEGALGSFSDSGSTGYSRTFTCDADVGEHPNTATIDETGENSSENVIVECYTPTIDKDAYASFSRDWTWTIDKSADFTSGTINEGESVTVNYTVQVNGTYVDSAYSVYGTIYVGNPHPSRSFTADLSDLVDGTAATLLCTNPLVVPPGGATCDYTTTVGSAPNTNTASFTLFGLTYSKTVDVGDPVLSTETDECIDVTDTFGGFLGTVCAPAATSQTFNYSKTFGTDPASDVVLQCGPNTHTNIASFVSNDNGETGEDNWTVNIEVVCQVNFYGCTPGYWKNHTDNWPSPYSPGQTLGSVFNLGSFPNLSSQTLLQALDFNGGGGLAGGARILLRAAVAGLLNYTEFGAEYPGGDIISSVNAALTSGNRNAMLSLAQQIDQWNNTGCPLN